VTTPEPSAVPPRDPAAPPGPRSPERPRSTRGAKVLTASGALVLVGTVVVAVLVGRTFIGLIPVGLLGPDGEPGPAVVASIDAPGSAQVDLDAGRYAVLVAYEADGDAQEGDELELVGDLQVLAPDGTPVRASGGAQVTMRSARGDVVAHTVAAFTVAQPGTHTVTVPATQDGSPATVLLTPDQDFLPFFTGIFSTILGVFLVIGLGFVGTAMAVGGGIWWALARRPRLPSADLPRADGGPGRHPAV
jgi:hypothetical protein